MKIIQFENSKDFYNESIQMLRDNILENNLLIGLLLQSMKNGNTPLLMALGYEVDAPVVACLQTIPEQVIVAFSTKQAIKESKAFVALLADAKVERVIGRKIETTQLANEIAELKGASVSVHMQQRLYSLKEVTHANTGAGTLKKMETGDLDLVTEWVVDFQTCITPGKPLQRDEALTFAEQQLKKGGLYLYLIDGVPVSMANATRPVEKTITVNLVYTPARYRKKGYASDCVAALSQQCLNQGYESLLLYTDLSNPTSNHIYQSIGYKPIANSVSMQIGKKSLKSS